MSLFIGGIKDGEVMSVEDEYNGVPYKVAVPDSPIRTNYRNYRQCITKYNDFIYLEKPT